VTGMPGDSPEERGGRNSAVKGIHCPSGSIVRVAGKRKTPGKNPLRNVREREKEDRRGR